jgi:hypothetical protein
MFGRAEEAKGLYEGALKSYKVKHTYTYTDTLIHVHALVQA